MSSRDWSSASEHAHCYKRRIFMKSLIWMLQPTSLQPETPLCLMPSNTSKHVKRKIPLSSGHHSGPGLRSPRLKYIEVSPPDLSSPTASRRWTFIEASQWVLQSTSLELWEVLWLMLNCYKSRLFISRSSAMKSTRVNSTYRECSKCKQKFNVMLGPTCSPLGSVGYVGLVPMIT